MPRKITTHPFQLELLQRQKDKARIERELKLRQRIYKFAELSDKERNRRFAFLIAEKQFAAQRCESSSVVVPFLHLKNFTSKHVKLPANFRPA
jgi:hypothetical protein